MCRIVRTIAFASPSRRLHTRIACALHGVFQKCSADSLGEVDTLPCRIRSQVIAHPLERLIMVGGVLTASGALFSLLLVGTFGATSDHFLVLWMAIAIALTPLAPLLDQRLRPLFWHPAEKESMGSATDRVMGAWTQGWLRCTYVALLLGLLPTAQLEASNLSSSTSLRKDDRAGVDEAYLCACLFIQGNPWSDAVEGSSGDEYPVG